MSQSQWALAKLTKRPVCKRQQHKFESQSPVEQVAPGRPGRHPREWKRGELRYAHVRTHTQHTAGRGTRGYSSFRCEVAKVISFSSWVTRVLEKNWRCRLRNWAFFVNRLVIPSHEKKSACFRQQSLDKNHLIRIYFNNSLRQDHNPPWPIQLQTCKSECE